MYLFQPFVFRPDRDDFSRFHYVVEDPFLKSGTDSIRFEIGSLDIYNVAFNTSYNYFNPTRHMGYERGEQIVRHRRWATRAWARRTRAALEEYSAWKYRCIRNQQVFQDSGRIGKVLAQLNKVHSIEISLKSCSFKSGTLMTSWGQGGYNTQFKRINREFSTILQAVQSVSPRLKLTELRHDELPATFFSVNPKILERHTRPFLHLEPSISHWMQQRFPRRRSGSDWAQHYNRLPD